ncbi:MAG: hypothetical protein L0H59_09195 [Tomitella sp.]|nr:hypothetical protein [Tomitella sp.]
MSAPTTTYTPATIPPALRNTLVGVLLTAADIAVTEQTDDAIADAVTRTAASRSKHETAEAVASRIAWSRHPLALTTQTPHVWRTWQTILSEPWPILADAAACLVDADWTDAGIMPGRWTID